MTWGVKHKSLPEHLQDISSTLKQPSSTIEAELCEMCVLVEPRRWNSRGNEKTSRDISEEDFLSVIQPYSGSDIEKN